MRISVSESLLSTFSFLLFLQINTSSHTQSSARAASTSPSRHSERRRARGTGKILGPQSYTTTLHDSPYELVKLFFATLLPDYSVNGGVHALGLSFTIAMTFFFLEGGNIKPPSTPFRCDDSSLHKPFKEDQLPTTWFLPIMVASGTSLILGVEFQAPDGIPTEATYWAARHLQRFYVGTLIVGNLAFVIQLLTNVKRPHFIDSCQPTTYLPNGTEVLACPHVGTSGAIEGSEETLNKANEHLWTSSFIRGSEVVLASPAFADIPRSASRNFPGNVTGLLPVEKSFSGEKPGTTDTIFHRASRAVNSSFYSSLETSNSKSALNGAFGRGKPQGILGTHGGHIVGVPGRSPDGVVVDYHCSGPNKRKSGHSFPSGLATAVGFESAILFAHSVYKLWTFHMRLPAAVLGLLLGGFALFMCANRVIYSYNHVIDVLSGYLIGAAGGVLFGLWPFTGRIHDNTEP